jgi:hypothetical protein
MEAVGSSKTLLIIYETITVYTTAQFDDEDCSDMADRRTSARVLRTYHPELCVIAVGKSSCVYCQVEARMHRCSRSENEGVVSF